MQPDNHPLAAEELMAYLDGELPADRAVFAAAHLDECAECRALVDGLRIVSQALPAWDAEPSDERVVRTVMDALNQRRQAPPPATVKPPRKWFGLPRWAWAVASVSVVVVLVPLSQCSRRRAVMMTAEGPMGLFRPPADVPVAYDRTAPVSAATAPVGASQKAKTRGGLVGGVASETGSNLTGPMIARTAQLQLTTRDFDHVRARLDDILQRHRGYFGELGIASPAGSGRTLSGRLQIPAAGFDAALSEIRQLGHVDSETQSGEEVTAQFTDLEARLLNSRHTEQRMIDLLRERTGKLSDVLDAERELDRVRGEIEQMEAQRKGLLTRVEFASLTLSVTEEYKAQIRVDSGPFTRIRNAAVDGLGGAAGSLEDVALFLLSGGPVLLLWAAILFFPARFAWRRWRARHRAQA